MPFRASAKLLAATSAVAAGLSALALVTPAGAQLAESDGHRIRGEPRSAQVDACGIRPRKTPTSRWTCTFVDDFEGSRINRKKWLPQTAFVTGEEAAAYACYYDDPDNVAVRNGLLRLTVYQRATPRACQGRPAEEPTAFASGSVTTYHRFSQRFGRFQARIKVSSANRPGLQEAFWLWPDDRQRSSVPWPAAGEIDIVETYSQYPDLGIPFLHYTAYDNGGPVVGLNTAWDCPVERGRFNVYTLVRTAEQIKISINGRTCLVNRSGDPAFTKKYIVTLTQGLGQGGNAYDGSARMPSTMRVDYVRVWR